MQYDTLQVDVRNYGAVGDGVTLCTDAFSAAIQALAEQGGGTLVVPPGKFLTGSIFLRSHVRLHLDAGATILGSEDPADYPLVDLRWQGVNQPSHAGLIAGSDLENIAITGSGTIDGCGAAWWARHHAQTLERPRPRLISPVRCRRVRIEDITVCNSPSWTINPLLCDDVVIDGVTVLNPRHSPNTDGINPDSCRNVRITRCYVDVGDDCIAIKAGSEGVAVQAPCENIIVSDCVLMHGHGGVVIGSEMSGGVRNVLISNCVFDGTDRGIRIKTRRGRGGVVEDIRVTNVVMRSVSCPISVYMYYKYYGSDAAEAARIGSREPQPVTPSTPIIRNIHFSHVTARNIIGTASGFLFGLPESPISSITLDDVHLEAAEAVSPGAKSPAMMMGPLPETDGELFAQNVGDLRLHDVTLTRRSGPALRLVGVEGFTGHGLVSSRGRSVTPDVIADKASSAIFRDCWTADANDPLLVQGLPTRIHGDETIQVTALSRHASYEQVHHPP